MPSDRVPPVTPSHRQLHPVGWWHLPLLYHSPVIFKVNPPEERSTIAEFVVTSSIQTVLSPGIT